jgi:alpha-1,6-mannosyltransferase
VVRLANAIAPHSGGLRTALRELGAGYARAGHDPVLIMPGLRPGDEQTEQGRVITVPGPLVPGTGGYRVITARRSLRRLLEDLEPDRLEVSDRTTVVALRRSGAMVLTANLPDPGRMLKVPEIVCRPLAPG